MPTLILTPRYTEDSQTLWRVAINLGWDVERLTKWQIPNSLLSVKEPVLYLEALMAPMFAKQFKLQLLEPPEDWLPKLPEKYRKREIQITIFAQARKLEIAAFIKPPNNKGFPAKVYKGNELPDGYSDNTPVLIAEIVEWEKEFRCFILNRTLKTFSIYLREGILQKQQNFYHSKEEEKELINFVDELLADKNIEFPTATVLDVGVIKDCGWAVVELNAAWGLGIYNCDPVKVLEVLRYAAVQN
ncbi:conserved hypothetical protein [Hyella patelloides LEGE 07179]|uniref:ATP-grasp domain-containing protein n=1 Tax=Hyella patelloides LEGE 07179 TaxID=945734 RepID=A0A563W1F7_9CYAN|nr:ATP-grasp domain-containing protein [Hyella patelloides]VEP17511.1 conserved hypothetical protein [Hyella patelloides LEGE 07179]